MNCISDKRFLERRTYHGKENQGVGSLWQRCGYFHHCTGGREKIAAEAGIDIEIIKGTIAEVPDKQAQVDVVFTTANYRKPLDKPHLSVFGLVSGVNEAGTKAKVAELLKKVAES